MKNDISILIAEDETDIREIVKEYVAIEGYDVYEASDGAQAIEIVKNQKIDLIILDITMPNVDGWVACKEIRKMTDAPIIMLSARSQEYDKLFGFELGADDYVTKPFSPKELMARVKANLKRTKVVESKIIKYKELEINTDAKTASLRGEKLNLTPKEYELLEFFCKNPGIAFSRERLLDAVWGYDYFGEDRTVDTHVKALRNSLKDYRKCIVTVWGIGYRFEEA